METNSIGADYDEIAPQPIGRQSQNRNQAGDLLGPGRILHPRQDDTERGLAEADNDLPEVLVFRKQEPALGQGNGEHASVVQASGVFRNVPNVMPVASQTLNDRAMATFVRQQQHGVDQLKTVSSSAM